MSVAILLSRLSVTLRQARSAFLDLKAHLAAEHFHQTLKGWALAEKQAFTSANRAYRKVNPVVANGQMAVFRQHHELAIPLFVVQLTARPSS